MVASRRRAARLSASGSRAPIVDRHGQTKAMNRVRLLIYAYCEALHRRLEAAEHLLTPRIKQLLTEEIEKQTFGTFDSDKFAAYLEACLAFVQERLESYNPIGVQHLFDQTSTQEAFELDLALSWYDSRAEYQALVTAARHKAPADMTDEIMRQLAHQLIIEHGAYPDQSIIAGYEAAPTLNKLPDYIVARAIEEQVRPTKCT